MGCGEPVFPARIRRGEDRLTRVVFMGSPEDAVIVLDALASASYEVVAVYTRPDTPAGRSRIPLPTAVRRRAEELRLHVETPNSLRDRAVIDQLAQFRADAFVVAAYGRLIPEAALKLPRLGALNLHPSLLPRHRGPSPVSSAILQGDSVTGVTIMLLDEGMDTGPVVSQSQPVPIEETDTGSNLTTRLFRVGAPLLIQALGRLAAGTAAPTPQDPSKATVTKLLQRSDGQLDWTRPAEYLARMTRAYDPWPGTFTRWAGRSLKVLEATAVSGDGIDGEPGTVRSRPGGLFVIAGDSMLQVLRLQLEGRSPQAAAEFLRGHPQIDGAKLGA